MFLTTGVWSILSCTNPGSSTCSSTRKSSSSASPRAYTHRWCCFLSPMLSCLTPPRATGCPSPTTRPSPSPQRQHWSLWSACRCLKTQSGVNSHYRWEPPCSAAVRSVVVFFSIHLCCFSACASVRRSLSTQASGRSSTMCVCGALWAPTSPSCSPCTVSRSSGSFPISSTL